MPQKKQKKNKKNKEKLKDNSLPMVSGESQSQEMTSTESFLPDSGNGLRITDVKLFLEPSFAQPVSEEDELCREFGQIAVFEMLLTSLSEETALVSGHCLVSSITNTSSKILWYNKSRAKSRICPSCLRLYSVGEDLVIPITREASNAPALQRREQELSGFCESVS
jgi:hypothetical protein